jgi:hypothetical protein
MNEAIAARLNERLRRRCVACAVPASLPVLFFGDLFSARVASVGLNPSWQEYLSKGRTELEGAKRRFETLTSVGAVDRASLTDAQCAQAICTMRDYFGPDKPVYSWFAGLTRVVEGFGASFRAGTAVHLDLVQESTDPVWSDIFKSDRIAGTAMLNADLPFLRWQLETFAISVVLCTSRTVLDNVARITDAQRLEDGEIAGRRWTLAQAAIAGRRIAVVGWNIPLARQPGMTRAQQSGMGAHLRERILAAGLCAV